MKNAADAPKSAAKKKLLKLEISKLFKNARRYLKDKSLDILLAPSLSKDSAHIIIAIGKKVGNATHRNKIRRRIKAIFYQDHYAQKGYDCIVIVKSHAVHATFQDLKSFFYTAFHHPQLPKCNNFC